MRTIDTKKRRPVLAGLLLGLAWSVCMFGAFPPVSLWALAFVAPIPLGLAGMHAGAFPKRTSLGFGLGATLFWGVTHFWISQISFMGWPPLVLYLSLYPALAVWLTARLVRTFPKLGLCVLLPIGLTATETLRARAVFEGYFWYLPAQPLIDAPALAWSAGFVGVLGLGALIAALAGYAIDRRRRSVPIVAFVLLVLGALHWTLTIRDDDPNPETIRIATVQTNLPQTLRGGWGPVERLQTMQELMRQSQRASELEPDLIVWPETLFPGDVIEPAHAASDRDAGLIWNLPDGTDPESLPTFARDELLGYDDRLAVRTDLPARFIPAWQRGLGVPLLVGAGGFDGYRVLIDAGLDIQWDARHNSVYMLRAGSLVGTRYDKLKLTPFGEEMPYISLWPWLERQMLAFGAQGMSFDLDRGDGAVAFEIDMGSRAVRIATPICFEATEPRVMRDLVYQESGRTNLLVQLTNDGWFGRAVAARTSHRDMVRWQALLTGTPLVRCANTGLSCAIDSWGRVVEPIGADWAPGPRERGVLVVDVPLNAHPTPQGQLAKLSRAPGLVWLPEWLGWACVMLAAVGLMLSYRRKDSKT